MKKKIMSLAVTLLAVISLNAQQIGIKGGANFSGLTSFEEPFDDKDDFSSKLTSYHLGVFAELMLSDNIGLQPELLYSSQGIKIDDKFDAKVQLDYLNLPVMLKFYLTEALYLEAGPQVGFLINEEVSIDKLNFKYNLDGNLNSTDFTFNVGAGFKFVRGLSINARYGFGLTGIYDLPESFKDNNPKNSVFSASIGYVF